jgi:hypothetical protein
MLDHILISRNTVALPSIESILRLVYFDYLWWTEWKINGTCSLPSTCNAAETRMLYDDSEMGTIDGRQHVARWKVTL